MTISGWHGGPAGPTVWIGSATAWLGVLAAATWLWASPIRLLSLALRDPERVRPTAVLFTDRVPSPQVVADLEARGIRVLEQEGDGSLVRVTLDPEANRRQVEAVVSGDDPIWSVHPDDLLTPDVLAELRAIDRSTRRQQLIIGVGRLMALAKTRKFKEGTGFWFAPHLWYIRSMSRDSDETDSESVGPPYHRLLSAAARHYCHEVFRAASVDLVFIEDGVALEGVERVLVQLFDHYDIWGAEPIQERHFQAVPLVQIMIHDVTHDSHLDREGYPEPDYDEIGRARILHIMQDRGGEDEGSSDTLAPTHEPLVAGIV